jgi:methionyl aminopeptidase
MISCKSPREIELMKEAGRIIILVFEKLSEFIKPGINTKQIDEFVEKIITDEGGYPASKGYMGYPGAICISVNDTLIHGIPSEKIILREGDIVSCDVVVRKNGYHADATRTFAVGQIRGNAKRLIETTEASFFEGVKLIKPGVRLGDISHRIQEYIESSGYSIVRDFSGHGIGQQMHEDPHVYNFGKQGTGPILQEGMCLAIEPMVNEGKSKVRVLNDGWTVKTCDKKLSCHYENTVVVTKDGCEIITL